MSEEVDDLFEFFLLLFQSGDVTESDLDIAVLLQLGFAASELHRLAASALLVHDHVPEHYQYRYHDQRRQERYVPRRRVRRRVRHLDYLVLALFVEILCVQIIDIEDGVGICLVHLAVLRLTGEFHLIDADLVELLFPYVLCESRESDFLDLLARHPVKEKCRDQDE